VDRLTLVSWYCVGLRFLFLVFGGVGGKCVNIGTECDDIHLNQHSLRLIHSLTLSRTVDIHLTQNQNQELVILAYRGYVFKLPRCLTNLLLSSLSFRLLSIIVFREIETSLFVTQIWVAKIQSNEP